VKTGRWRGGRNPWRGQTQRSSESFAALHPRAVDEFSEGSKPRNRIGCDLPRIYSSGCAAENGKWARAVDKSKGLSRMPGSHPGRDSEPGSSERKKLPRVNPMSGMSEQIGHRKQLVVRQGRRNVVDDALAGLPVNLTGTEYAVGAQNLTKAAAARKGCRGRSGRTLKESQSLREMSQEATPALVAGVKYLTRGC
jgi:hypothetical protein